MLSQQRFCRMLLMLQGTEETEITREEVAEKIFEVAPYLYTDGGRLYELKFQTVFVW